MKFLLSADGDIAVNAEKVDALVIDFDDAGQYGYEKRYSIVAICSSEQEFILAQYKTRDDARKDLTDLLKVLSGYASDGILNLIERYKKHEG